MGWFKQHLNWTYVLAFSAALVINAVLVTIMIQAGNYELDWLLFVDLPILLFGLVIVPAWVLRQKGRSLWHLLWYFLGILPIVVLCLENRAGNRLVREESKNIK